MDEDWHAVCQAIFYGIEGQEWEHVYHKSVIRAPVARPRLFGKTREAKANGDEYYDRGRRRQIESRAALRQAMWEQHLQSLVSALEEALRRREAGGGRTESSTAGGSAT